MSEKISKVEKKLFRNMKIPVKKKTMVTIFFLDTWFVSAMMNKFDNNNNNKKKTTTTIETMLTTSKTKQNKKMIIGMKSDTQKKKSKKSHETHTENKIKNIKFSNTGNEKKM